MIKKGNDKLYVMMCPSCVGDERGHCPTKTCNVS